METIAKPTFFVVKTEVKKESSTYEKFLERAQFNYFFLISFFVTVGSCLGGITAMYVLQGNAPIWQLCLNIYISMANNVACIGQAPLKWVINIFAASILTNIALILVNVL